MRRRKYKIRRSTLWAFVVIAVLVVLTGILIILMR